MKRTANSHNPAGPTGKSVRLTASAICMAMQASRGTHHADNLAASIEPGQVITFVDGTRARLLQTTASIDGSTIRLATETGERNLSAKQFLEMGPVSPAMLHFAAFVRHVFSFDSAVDDYVKEAIRSAGWPVDDTINWSKYLEKMYAPLLSAITRDVSLRDDAVRDMIVSELYDKRILSPDSTFAHFNPNHPSLIGKPLERRVTAFLIAIFKFRKSQVATTVRRSLGVGAGGEVGLKPVTSISVHNNDQSGNEGRYKNDLADLRQLQHKTVEPAVTEMMGSNEVKEFLNAFKTTVAETEGSNTAAVLDFISEGVMSGMTRREISESIMKNARFVGRFRQRLDRHAVNYLLARWGNLIRAFAADANSGWSQSPISRMIVQSAQKGKNVKSSRTSLLACLNLAACQ